MTSKPRRSVDPLSPTSVVVADGVDSSSSPPTSSSSHSAPMIGSSNDNSSSAPHDEEDLAELRSPTSVKMVSSTSSASLLPTAAASVVTPTAASARAAIVVKPFFVMDWLEEINPRDLELARQMLHTPPKKKGWNINRNNSTSSSSHQSPSTSSSPMAGFRLFSKPSATQQREYSPSSSASPETTPSKEVHQSLLARSSPESCNQLSTRNSIALPTLIPEEEHIQSEAGVHNQKDQSTSVCRQLYASESQSASYPPSRNHGSTITVHNTSSSNMSTSTSTTSVSSIGSQDNTVQVNHHQQPTPTPHTASPPAAQDTPQSQSQSEQEPVAKMSPFKKRSIAIGNGWNAKGLHKAKKGSWESALACWENALEIRTQVLGETHPDVANTYNNIGIALGKLERFDAAIEVLERALELRAKHYGTREHVEVAATLHNIGNVLHAAGDCAGAIQCFWDAKLLQEQLLGPNHVQVARACVAIANVYYEAAQYEDAREAYCDALQVFGNAGLTGTHPEVMAVQQDLQDIENIRAQQHQQYYNAHEMHYYQQQHHRLRYQQHQQLHYQPHQYHSHPRMAEYDTPPQGL